MILFADISEFQESFDARAYRGAGNEVIICRVHNGYRPDNMMPGRLAAVRAVNFVAVGYYIYLAANRDAATQVREAISVIGTLRPNEFPIVDLEEGGGDQTARAEQACGAFDRWCGFPSTLYSGAAFFKNQLSGVAHWKRPRWIAGYLNSYRADMAGWPAGASFWQYSDRAHFTGLPGAVDASVYPDSAKLFLADVRAGARPAPKPAAPEEENMAVGIMHDGREEVFIHDDAGVVWHRWQDAKPGGWTETWHSLGKPGG
jgi:GH25 family lysozyme M1 (1,4-beta-N-acetylmuramidase)